MFQQTRVAAVIPYYERFLKLFPTPAALARARETTVLRAWAGLGYYSRARNLQAAAREIARRGFPATYDEARRLPGIGPYTAAAVMSIAHGHPHAAVDGNVRRVLARVLASHSVDQAHAKAEADELLDRARPGDFNQAMMELGATICTPRTPRCAACPVSRFCEAHRRGQVARFPAPKVKRAQESVRIRWVLLTRDDDAILLDPPKPDGLWRGFWTLPDVRLGDAVRIATVRHTVTFRNIQIAVYTGKMSGNQGAAQWIGPARLKRLPLATPLRKVLKVVAQAFRPAEVRQSRPEGLRYRGI